VDAAGVGETAAVVALSCCLGKAESTVPGLFVVVDAALVGALFPDNFLVNVSSGDGLLVGVGEVGVDVDASGPFSLDADARGPLATRAVSESVGFFSFIPPVYSVGMGGWMGKVVVVGVVGEAAVTVTAGVCACAAVAMTSVGGLIVHPRTRADLTVVQRRVTGFILVVLSGVCCDV
jgi:hypothetical protein